MNTAINVLSVFIIWFVLFLLISQLARIVSTTIDSCSDKSAFSCSVDTFLLSINILFTEKLFSPARLLRVAIITLFLFVAWNLILFNIYSSGSLAIVISQIENSAFLLSALLMVSILVNMLCLYQGQQLFKPLEKNVSMPTAIMVLISDLVLKVVIFFTAFALASIIGFMSSEPTFRNMNGALTAIQNMFGLFKAAYFATEADGLSIKLIAYSFFATTMFTALWLWFTLLSMFVHRRFSLSYITAQRILITLLFIPVFVYAFI